MQTTMVEYMYGDYAQLGVAYHGKNGEPTWVDERKASEFTQD